MPLRDTPRHRHRDPHERKEGPEKKLPTYTLVCEGCGKSFKSTDSKARECHRCLWKALSW